MSLVLTGMRACVAGGPGFVCGQLYLHRQSGPQRRMCQISLHLQWEHLHMHPAWRPVQMSRSRAILPPSTRMACHQMQRALVQDRKPQPPPSLSGGARQTMQHGQLLRLQTGLRQLAPTRLAPDHMNQV